MKFETMEETYRYYAVSGEDARETEYLKSWLIKTKGQDAFNELEQQIAPEVERGSFLSTPPRFVG